MQINDFEFKKVIIPVTFTNGSVAEYQLLVDGDERIHYYKIKWFKVYIEQVTTAAHKQTKKNNKSYLFRINLLEALNIKHFYSDEHQKNKIKLNEHQINVINEVFDKAWLKETFQNIIYVITGSNASGEGKPSSSQVRWNGKAIGFFLQCLNISKNCVLSNDIYKKIFSEQKNSLSFEQWIKSFYMLKESLEKFNSYKERNKWKNDYIKLKKTFSAHMKLQENIDKHVCKERRQFEKLARVKYPYLSNFWNNCENTKPTYAHIKPVKVIRKKCNGKDFDILKQISDINNCLPLTFDIHKYYDDGYFYWRENGKIRFTRTDNYSLPSNIENFLAIPKEKLNAIKQYIIDYEKLFESQNS